MFYQRAQGLRQSLQISRGTLGGLGCQTRQSVRDSCQAQLVLSLAQVSPGHVLPPEFSSSVPFTGSESDSALADHITSTPG